MLWLYVLVFFTGMMLGIVYADYARAEDTRRRNTKNGRWDELMLQVELAHLDTEIRMAKSNHPTAWKKN